MKYYSSNGCSNIQQCTVSIHQTTGVLSFAFLSPLPSASFCKIINSDLLLNTQGFMSLAEQLQVFYVLAAFSWTFSSVLALILGRKASIEH